ncbi:MAG: type II toxin-antitoxin system RelE/ParE family toxin [Pirellulaceae bacterium]
MNYEVRVHRLARLDLVETYQWAHRRAPKTAESWLGRFREAIRSLETAPERCPLAIENTKVTLEIRELRFGKRPNVFRIIFVVDGRTVRVLRIRRGQRRFLTRRQIEEAADNDDLSHSS